MSIVDQKKKVFGDIAALRTSVEGFPKTQLGSSMPSINNEGDAVSFLTDLLKSLVGFESLKNVVVNALSHNLDSIEDKIKISLKKSLSKLVSCSINPSIPDWVKHTSFSPSSTGINLELRRLDYLGIMLVEPNSQSGNLLYSDTASGINSKDFNTFLYNTVQANGISNNWGSNTMSNDILTLKFNSTGGVVNDVLNVKVSPYYSNPANGKKLSDLNNDYIDSIKLFESEKIVASIIDSIFGSISVDIKKSVSQMKTEAEINKILSRIIDADETKVIDDSYFTFSNEDAKLFESKIEDRKRGVLRLDNSLDIETRIDLDDLTTFNSNVTNATNSEDKTSAISNGLDMLASKSASNVNDKDNYTAKLNFIDNIVKNLMMAISNVILSPKVIAIFALNHQIVTGESFSSATDFMKGNKTLIRAILNSIRDEIVAILLKEAMKTITYLVQKNITDLLMEKMKNKKAQMMSLTGGVTKSANDKLSKLNK